jgi:hypothetical protein
MFQEQKISAPTGLGEKICQVRQKVADTLKLMDSTKYKKIMHFPIHGMPVDLRVYLNEVNGRADKLTDETAGPVLRTVDRYYERVKWMVRGNKGFSGKQMEGEGLIKTPRVKAANGQPAISRQKKEKPTHTLYQWAKQMRNRQGELTDSANIVVETILKAKSNTKSKAYGILERLSKDEDFLFHYPPRVMESRASQVEQAFYRNVAFLLGNATRPKLGADLTGIILLTADADKAVRGGPEIDWQKAKRVTDALAERMRGQHWR